MLNKEKKVQPTPESGNNAKPIVIRCGVCLNCGFEDELSAFDEDVEYDEFWGVEHKYPVCPKCGGGVETYSHHFV